MPKNGHQYLRICLEKKDSRINPQRSLKRASLSISRLRVGCCLIKGNNFFQKKLGVANYKGRLPHRGEAALCKHLREQDQKAALSSGIRNSINKPRVIKNSATCRIRICDLATLSLTHWPLSHGCLNSPQTSH